MTKNLEKGHHDTVETISVSKDGRYLYSAGADFLRCVFDLTSNELLEAKVPLQTQRISVIDAFQWDGRSLFLSGMVAGRTAARSALIVEDAESDQQWHLPSPADDVQSVAVSDDGQITACGLRSGAVVLFDLRHLFDNDSSEDVKQVNKRWMAHEGRGYGLAFILMEGNYFRRVLTGNCTVGNLDHDVAETTLSLLPEQASFQTRASGVASSPATHDTIAVTQNGALVRLSASGHPKSETLSHGLSGSEPCWWSPDGRYAATSNLETGFQYWDLNPHSNLSSSASAPLPLAKVLWKIQTLNSGQLVTSVSWLSDKAVLLTRQKSPHLRYETC